MASLLARRLCAAALILLPPSLDAQSKASSVLNPLGETATWQCFPTADPTMRSGPFALGTAALMMTFAEVGPTRAPTLEAATLRARRFLIVGYTAEGELLLFSEMRLDTLTRPAVKMVDIRREARGGYSGQTNAPDPAQPAAPPLRQNDRRTLTDSEVAQALVLGRELWRLRCSGPRV